MTSPMTQTHRGRWQQLNVYAGYLVFGFPAVAAVPALAATVARFGLIETLSSATLAAAIACLPLMLWIRYTRRAPGTWSGKITWAVIGMVAVGALAFSPIFFWAGPAMLVLLSEFLRLAAGPTLSAAGSRLTARRHAPASRRAR